MLSRVADALFWMARYYERAENTSRLIDVNINMMLDMGHALSDAGSSAPLLEPDHPHHQPVRPIPCALSQDDAGKRAGVADFR
jgi:uncharacterized alpha-E superfamily protein